jgi:FAD binding domain/Berberine and berberine like
MTVSAGALSSAVKGRVVERGDPGYDEARALYNGMIDRRPAAIAYCVDEADVSAAIRHARGEGLALAIRCGGHSGAGFGSVDDGIVADLSEMHEVTVDPEARVAHVQGGAQLKQLLDTTHEHGLTVPVGVIGTTGVGGLTLGGGLGHFTRGFGLTIDNLLAATVVLADGSVTQCDAEHEPDLFWAIRGGGGNYGVVTKFTFRCHPASTVLAGPVMYDIEETPQVMRWYDGFIAGAPEQLSGFVSIMSVPPGPPFPEELHLRKVCALVWTQVGEEESDALREARAYGAPLIDGVAAMPVPVWNTAFDEMFPPGEQWAWKGDFVKELPDEALEQHREWGRKLPSWKSLMHLYAIDAAGSRPGNDETAWGYRDARWAQVIAGVDSDAANAGTMRDWAAGYAASVRPYAMAGGYQNFQMDEPERVRGMYGANYDRLAQIKAHYDPENVFRVNQNIKPG